MQKRSTTRKPYYHIHIDGKQKENLEYTDFAKELGFVEMPFSRIGDFPPITHLTKKYSESDRQKMLRDFGLLKADADQLSYTGYIECERIMERHMFSNGSVQNGQTTPLPFKVKNRKLRLNKGEEFKIADIHITISTYSDPSVILALGATGLLMVRPLYEDSIVYTLQFANENGFREFRDAILEFITANFARIPLCIVKVERIIDYSLHNVIADDLPLVLDTYNFNF